MQPLDVIIVITVHVTTPFLRPFLEQKFFFAHTCLHPFFNYYSYRVVNFFELYVEYLYALYCSIFR